MSDALDVADWKTIMVALQDSMTLYEKTYGEDEAQHWNANCRLVRAKAKVALAALGAGAAQPVGVPNGVREDIEELASFAAEAGKDYEEAWLRVKAWLDAPPSA